METEQEAAARKRVQARFGFVVHVAMYIVMNAGLFTIWLLTGHGYPWFMWPALGWGIGVIGHGIALAIGPGSTLERRAIERELQRDRAVAH